MEDARREDARMEDARREDARREDGKDGDGRNQGSRDGRNQDRKEDRNGDRNEAISNISNDNAVVAVPVAVAVAAPPAPKIREVVKSAGLVFSEKGEHQFVLSKPKIMPIKSKVTEQREEQMKEAGED
ncbi:hypothetical protein TrRE_jg3277 [Triparma retinervis]|uniref:Uncharacterized protein n=1 Tax=Triparma retinervis TaxID=2557542 RepID=A0A9W7DYR3_9STRA|nr:hypothetical protein TrRE_jg3277 [Triparma retinervis]